jgi:hypothetical protein
MCAAATSWRTTHNLLAGITVYPLLFSVLTGFCYRIGRNVLKLEKASCNWLMDLHTLSIIQLHYIYPVIIAVMTITLIITGLPMSLFKNCCNLFNNNSLATPRTSINRGISANSSGPNPYLQQFYCTTNRSAHRVISSLIAIPLFLTSITGLIFAILNYWFEIDRKQISILLYLHQGSYLKDAAIYIGILGILGFITIFTGFRMISYISSYFGNGNSNSEERVRYTMLSVSRAFEMAPMSHENEFGLTSEDEKHGRHQNNRFKNNGNNNNWTAEESG